MQAAVWLNWAPQLDSMHRAPCASPVLDNGALRVRFDARGISELELIGSGPLAVLGDSFGLQVAGGPPIRSAALSQPEPGPCNASHHELWYTSGDQRLHVQVEYALPASGAFVTKTLTLHAADDAASKKPTRLLQSVDLLSGAAFLLNGVPPSSTVTLSSRHGFNDTAIFARWADAPALGALGMLVTAHNPFLGLRIGGAAADAPTGSAVAYEPQLRWRVSDGELCLDSAVVGLHRLAGETLAPPAEPLDQAEQAALVAAVRGAISSPLPKRAQSINIGWCENDYQLDIAQASGRAEYKRIIDRAAQLGISHLLFAPQNSDVSSRANNTDAWGWEQLLWFGMGQKLRRGEWAPHQPLPPSLLEMLAHFKKRRVLPVAYVYPILAFLAGTEPGGGSPPWIVNGTYVATAAPSTSSGSGDRGAAAAAVAVAAASPNRPPLRSSLADADFQRWLPKTLLAFANQTGAGGFSFDYTYFEERPPIASVYAQWAGWRAILRTLQTAGGGRGCAGAPCLVDNRQQNHAWGPWMWAEGGSYAEPLMSDEQPGSWMFFEADLHTDRLSANRERQIAWEYRQLEMCPPELLPGFAFHQTDRDPSRKQRRVCATGRCANFSRALDFDLLGARYSLLSSVGTAGLNNVLNVLPARDLQEFELFPQEDIDFIRGWLHWADANVPMLKSTRALPQLSPPGAGGLDGVSMWSNDKGMLFVYNPTSRAVPLALPLNESIGFECGVVQPTAAEAVDAHGDFALWPHTPQLLHVRLEDDSQRDGAAPHSIALLPCGGQLRLLVPPTSALALTVAPWDGEQPLLLGANATAIRYNASTAMVAVVGATGEAGTEANLTLVLPAGSVVEHVLLNMKRVGAYVQKRLEGRVELRFPVQWEGRRFARSQEILPIASVSASGGGPWVGEFLVPTAAMQQLKRRNTSYALEYDTDPDGNDDANVPWLAPGRLLIFIKYTPLLNDTLKVTGSVDGVPLLIRHAYNTIVRSAARFIGFWADVTEHVTPDQPQKLYLELPQLKEWQALSGAPPTVDHLGAAHSTTVAAAKEGCLANPDCAGVAFEAHRAADKCAVPDSSVRPVVYLSSTSRAQANPQSTPWCTMLRTPSFVGVFFENIETIHTSRPAVYGIDSTYFPT